VAARARFAAKTAAWKGRECTHGARAGRPWVRWRSRGDNTLPSHNGPSSVPVTVERFFGALSIASSHPRRNPQPLGICLTAAPWGDAT
jgi:hypothetical protein